MSKKTIEVDLRIEPPGPCAVHHLPCKIEKDGSAPVYTYFMPKETEKGRLEASFRGHKLVGRTHSVPPEYTGLILQSSDGNSDGTENWVASGWFNEVSGWNWDKEPSNSDFLPKQWEWIEIAEALHGKIEK